MKIKIAFALFALVGFFCLVKAQQSPPLENSNGHILIDISPAQKAQVLRDLGFTNASPQDVILILVRPDGKALINYNQ